MLMAPTPRGGAPAPGWLAAPALQLHGPCDPQRRQVERYVAEVFARRFGARVTGFAPMLVSLRDAGDGEIVAAAGYRAAAGGPLFLEPYLAQPVEAALAQHLNAAPARAAIVEIGHMAATRAGAGRRLMIEIGLHLHRQGFRWIVCTLTHELRHLLPRLGITPLALAKADPQALAGAADWGTYYEHDPVVLAGELAPALRRYRRRVAAGPEAA